MPPNRIDLIRNIDGVSFEEAWNGGEEAILVSAGSDTPIYYIGLDELISNEEQSKRPKDIDDLTYLHRARRR